MNEAVLKAKRGSLFVCLVIPGIRKENNGFLASKEKEWVDNKLQRRADYSVEQKLTYMNSVDDSMYFHFCVFFLLNYFQCFYFFLKLKSQSQKKKLKLTQK